MGFLTGNVSVLVYKDSAQTEFPQQKIVDIDQAMTDDSVAEAQVLYIALAASGAQTVNLNGVSSVEKLFIYSDTTDLNVNINGLGDIPYKAGTPGIMPLSVSSLVITNASSSLATTATVALISG